MSLTLCQTFRTIASQTWDKLAVAKSFGCQISEEAFTDFNLLEIKIRHSKEVVTRTFTKREEGKTGADWEWWFKGKKGLWLGFRVQAKVINLISSEYEHLYYKSKDRKFQINKLINNALSHTHKLIPLYCLYSFWEHSDYPHFYELTRTKGAAEHFGCSVVDALTILEIQNKSNTKHIKDLFSSMVPWSYLVCHPSISNFDIADNAYRQWRNLIASRTEDDIYIQEYYQQLNSIALSPNAPDYINELLTTGSTETDDADLRHITIFLQPDSD